MSNNPNQPGHSPVGAVMLAVSVKAFKSLEIPMDIQHKASDEHAVHVGIGGPGFNHEDGGDHAI